MNQRDIDLTKGVLPLQIIAFSFPLMLSNLLQVLFNISDIAVVGKFAGPTALGAVGSTTILATLFTSAVIGMASGINVVTALSIGAGKEKEVRQSVSTSFFLMLICGAILLVIAQIAVHPVLVLLHTKEELLSGATSYLRIYFMGIPALMLYNFGNAVFSAAGNTKKPLRILTISGVVNVVLNMILVIFFKMDVYGVAIASVVAQYLSAAMILRELIVVPSIYRLPVKELHFYPELARRILRLSLPSAFQNSVFFIANLFVQAGVNSFSATVVAGNAAAANADNIIYDIMAAFYTACGSFMGQNLGAGNKKRVRESYLWCLWYPFLVALLLGILLLVFGEPFLYLFTSDAAVVAAGMERIRVMALSYCVSAFMDNTIAASRALGKTVVPTVIVILGSCVFRVVWIYTVFALLHTTTALYLLYIFSWVLTATAEIWYYRRVYRQVTANLS